MYKSMPTVAALLLAMALPATTANALLKKGADEARLAAQARNVGKMTLALKYFSTAIAKNPEQISWRCDRARIYMTQHDYKSALEDLDYVLKKEPNFFFALTERAHALEFMGDHKRALEACNLALRYNSISGDMLRLRQQCYENLGRHKDALADQALSLKYGYTEDTWKALAASGSTYGLKHPIWAAQILQKQIALAPDCPQLYLELCRIVIHNELRPPGEAGTLAIKAYSLSPVGSAFWREGHILLARDFSMRTKQQEAVKEYTIALKGTTLGGDRSVFSGITADNLDLALYRRAETLAELGEFNKAIEDITTLMKNHFPSTEYLKVRARYYQHINQADKGQADLLTASELEPDDVPISMQLLEAYKSLNKLQPAVLLVSQILKVNPEDELLYAERASLYMKLAQYEKAVADYTKLIEMNPDEQPLYRDRAAAYRKLGMKIQAEADEKRAARR